MTIMTMCWRRRWSNNRSIWRMFCWRWCGYISIAFSILINKCFTINKIVYTNLGILRSTRTWIWWCWRFWWMISIIIVIRFFTRTLYKKKKIDNSILILEMKIYIFIRHVNNRTTSRFLTRIRRWLNKCLNFQKIKIKKKLLLH